MVYKSILRIFICIPFVLATLKVTQLDIDTYDIEYGFSLSSYFNGIRTENLDILALWLGVNSRFLKFITDIKLHDKLTIDEFIDNYTKLVYPELLYKGLDSESIKNATEMFVNEVTYTDSSTSYNQILGRHTELLRLLDQAGYIKGDVFGRDKIARFDGRLSKSNHLVKQLLGYSLSQYQPKSTYYSPLTKKCCISWLKDVEINLPYKSSWRKCHWACLDYATDNEGCKVDLPITDPADACYYNKPSIFAPQLT